MLLMALNVKFSYHKRPIIQRSFQKKTQSNIEQAIQPIALKWMMGVRDLPNKVNPKAYVIDDRQITLSKRKRQVVDALIATPIYCASTVRIGDVGFRLKSENSLKIETKKTPAGRHFYSLESEVAA